MKKLLALLLALLMVLSLAACGEEEEETSSRRKKKDTETTSDTTEVTEEVEEEEEEEETEKEDKENTKSSYTVFEELDVEILDIDEATVTMCEFSANKRGNPTCTVEVENHTNGKLHVFPSAIAINGKIVDEYFTVEAEPKDTTSYDFVIYDAVGDPEEITRLSLYLNVLDDDFSGEAYLIDIYPQGMDAYEEDMPKRSGDVLLDKKGVYAAANKITYPEKYQPQVWYTAINDTDKVLDLNLNTVAINGFGVEDYHGNTILPGTYVEDYFELYSHEQLVELGMEANDLTSITVRAIAWDDDFDTVAENETTIYPDGEDHVEEFVYSPKKTDVVVAETEDFKLLQVSCKQTEWNDTCIMFVLENKSGKPLTLSGEDAKINGKEADLFFYCDSPYGLSCFTTIDIFESDLSDLGITNITSLEIELEAYNSNYKTIYEDTVKFNVTK